MIEVLTILFGFLIFMLVFNTGCLAVIRTTSLFILIAISLLVGAVLAKVMCWFFDAALILVILMVIAGIVVLIFEK
jgi:hypothetical protein